MTFVPVSYALNAKAGSRDDGESETFVVAAPLTKGSATGHGINQPGRRQEDDVNLVAFHMLQTPISDSHVTPGWGKGNRTGNASIAVASGQMVRRLTPTECERLQALPDGWTKLDDKTPDSRRYAGLGDAVTASVSFWIGDRIRRSDDGLL